MNQKQILRNKHHHLHTKRDVIRVNGNLKEVVTVEDSAGNMLHKIMSPLMIEFKFTDVIQVVIGASLLAIPLGLTDEAYAVAHALPTLNAVIISLLSLLFISVFVYYYYYREHLKEHFSEFIKRTLTTYILSFLMVALFLLLIQKISFSDDLGFAIKLTILAAFPASMSAAVADIFK